MRRIQEYILAGDAFQVVYSQRFQVPRGDVDPFDVYRALRVINPSPYMFHLEFPEAVVTGASPEVLVRLEGGEVEVRPIAGTRRRGANAEEDAALEAELSDDPKELAEHMMLIDLGRNDVGRVSAPGTVRLTERMAIERYSHVMHLIVERRGRGAPGIRPARRRARGVPGRDADAARPRSAPWRSSRSWSRRGAGSTAAPSATLVHGQHGLRDRDPHAGHQAATRSTCRRAPASSPTASPRRSTRSA